MGREYTINGVKVSFPVNAYPCQMAMMAKIMQGLKRGQNCLLESPTGSGKTLALLCASLAWQQAECARVDEYNRNLDMEEQALVQQLVLRELPQPRPESTPSGAPASSAAEALPAAGTGAARLPSAVDPAAQPPSALPAASAMEWGDDDADDFQTKGEKKLRTSLPNFPDTTPLDTSVRDTSVMSDGPDGTPQLPARKKRLKKPKIYFGTRTHKQIAQVTKELRRTSYKHAKMTILASRDHTCIHPEVSRSSNKNDGCRELRDPHNQDASCGFFLRANQRLRYQEQLPGEGLSEAWPLEELVKLGRRIRACPYYAGRNLKEEADIVFCPYNYLIEPSIREAMEINLQNQVVILDEAHNVEDSSREAASGSFQQAHILDAIRDLERGVSRPRQTEMECRDMARMLSHVSQWIDRHSDQLDQYKEFDRGCRVFSGTDMVAHFTTMGMGHDNYRDIQRAYGAIMTEEMDSSEESQHLNIQRLTSGTTTLLGCLVRELCFIYQDNMKYRDDFRIALVKSMSRATGPEQRGRWLSSRRKSSDPVWTVALHFWCLNPAVVFGLIGEEAHSVVVASGTLSPLGTFQSELGVPFPICLEASHVIKADQVYVSAISHGPRGGSMNATYRNSEQFSFQDELGELILGVCAAVPNGVLCFFPSYGMLNKLTSRWQVTGMWDRLEARKPVLSEPRRADEFEDMMRQFRHLVEHGDDSGALLLAVCRGKLSEGIDFSDDSARAVITVGIPFPNVKDIQVDLKKQYNNTHASSRGLLSGHEWYGIQAYRALNQALGRCIRHRYDWGAILLVDDRFSRPRGVDGLSKWVRSLVRYQSHWPEVADGLRQFAADMQRWAEERREEQRQLQQQQQAAEAERLAAAAALPSLPLSSGTSPMSADSRGSPMAPTVISAAQFSYGSPPAAGANGGQKVLLVPVSQFLNSAGAPSSGREAAEIVSENGRRCLRLADGRLVPLLTQQGAPVPAATEQRAPVPGTTGRGAGVSAETAPRRVPPSAGSGSSGDSAAAARQEIVSVNGRQYLRLTDEGRTRLVPLLTEKGAPLPAETEPGSNRPGAGSGSLDCRQTAAPAEKRPRPPSVSPVKGGGDRTASPLMFDEEEVQGRPPHPAMVVKVVGKRPLFRNLPAAAPAQASSQSPELVRKTVLPPGGSAVKRRDKSTKGVIFISSDEDESDDAPRTGAASSRRVVA